MSPITQTHRKQRASDYCRAKKREKETPHTLPLRDVSFYLTLSWWLVPVEILWPWSISHPQGNLTHSHRHFWQRPPVTQGSSQLTLCSTSPTLLSGHRILWENPAPHSHLLTAHSPSTTPSALRKVPYKGVGNIALVLHHHNKKKKKENTRCEFRTWTAPPASPQFVWTFSRTSLGAEFGEFFFLFHFFRIKKAFWGKKKPFMVVNKSEGTCPGSTLREQTVCSRWLNAVIRNFWSITCVGVQWKKNKTN